VKLLSDIREQFIASDLQPKDAKETVAVSEERSFQFDELTIQNPSIRREFAYDSEKARNFDQGNVDKAKVSVMQLLKDAIDKAKQQVGEIKSNARKQGYDTGFEGGFNKGKEAAKEEFSTVLETTQQLVEELSGFRKEMYDKVEREMIEMVISLTKKVIHFDFSTREDAVQDMIRLAVQSVLDRESMVIKIHPTDKKYAESFRPELHHMFSEIKNITFAAHSGIERGGCVVETNFGVIDARIEKLEEQIDRILKLAPAQPDKLIAASEASVIEIPAVDEESAIEEPEIQNDQQSPEEESDSNDTDSIESQD
jgi:flagellar assembly protein FliH